MSEEELELTDEDLADQQAAERAGDDAAEQHAAAEHEAREDGRDSEREAQENQQAAEREAQEITENNALAAVFDDVRECSAKSQLSTPARWEELGLVPDHMSAEDFEMYVYDYLDKYLKENKAQIEHEKAEAKRKTQHFHSAKTAVGIPAFMRDKKPEPEPASATAPQAASRAETNDAPSPTAQTEPASAPWTTAQTEPASAPSTTVSSLPENTPALENSLSPEHATSSEPADEQPPEPLFESARPERLRHARNTITVDDPENPFYGLQIPAGTKLEQVEGEWTLVEDTEAKPVKRELDPRCIAVLVGQHSYYLYDEDEMTAQYAQWAFLAAEDDPLMTFVNCVREEGRTYPRPLATSDLANPPFRMNATQVAETWAQVQESGAYPDIVQVKASNGDIYYASTLYLTAEYAESLAEWSSVGRNMNV